MKLFFLILAMGLASEPLAVRAGSAAATPAVHKPGTSSARALPQANQDDSAVVTALLKKPLTLSSVVRIALLNNRAILSTFEDVGLSEADLLDARSLTNPELDLSLKFPDRSPSGAMTEWGLTQNFLDLALIPLRTTMAREQLSAAKAHVADSVVQTVAEVKIAFIEIQADNLIGARLAMIRDAQKASLEFAQKLHEAGNITDLALLREQVAYSDSLLAIAQASAESRQHREALNRLLSLWGDQTDWKITADLPEIPGSLPGIGNLESLAVSQRADLAASRAELTATMQAAGLEKQFRFIGGLGLGLVGEHDSDGTNLNGPSLHLTLPIFNQGQSKVARSQSRLRQAERKFEGLAIDIRSNVRELRDQLVSEADIARYYHDQALPNRQKIVELIQLNYNAMLTGAFELFSARRDVLEVERQLIETSRDYWITHARLERTVGGDLTKPASEIVSSK